MSEYERYVDQLSSLLSELNPDMDVTPGTVNHDFIIKPNAAVAAAFYDEIEKTLDNMAISQVLAADDPDDDLVNVLLSNLRVKRREASLATGYVSVRITGTANVSIPASTIITCAGIQLQPLKTYVLTSEASNYSDTEDTAFVQTVSYDDGTRVAIIGVSSLDSFTGSLSTGQECSYNLTDPRVSAIEIASTVTGNAEDTNAELLAKAIAGVSATVLTGADNIRNFMLNNDEYVVRDAAVFGMGSAVMLRDKESSDAAGGGGSVDVYVRTDDVPVIQSVDLTADRVDDTDTWEVSIPADVFPGAAGVTSLFRGVNKITEYAFTPSAKANLQYPKITKTVDARYSSYQEAKLTFDWLYEDPSTTSMLVKVDVLLVQGLDLLQALVDDPDVRSNAFDVLVKGGIPVNVSIHATMKFPRGSDVPAESIMQTAVADAVNALPIGTGQLYTSILAEALKGVAQDATVVMPIHVDAAVYMPDGRTLYAHSTDALQAPEEEGISYENSMFVCYPGNVNVTVMES